MNNLHSNALLQSIKDAPLLFGDLSEAASFDRALLGMPTAEMRPNANQKLGHLFEDTLHLLLSASDQLEVLADHLQVFDRNQITLGEMDYILRDVRTQQVFQLELAVKFYLGMPTAEGWSFPGPNPHDNWQRKLQHMRRHQLTLVQRPEAQALLAERWGCAEVEARQLIYGCICYPMGVAECPLPESVRPDCRQGRWLYAQDWQHFFADTSEVCMIPKPLWPVVMTAPLRESLPRASISALHAASAERCVMFVLPNSEEPHFLVPNHWLG